MKKFERGAEWRQWDLHLHTASSYDYKYKAKDADEKLCQILRENRISAVAITDHFIIDKDRIERLRNIAPDIVFFPGVELRVDKGADNLHVIIIFDDKINLKELEEDFTSEMIRRNREGDKDENYYWNFEQVVKFAKEKDAILTIHAGGKSNGLEKEITNALDVKQAIKKEIADKIHVFEMGRKKDFESYENIVFKSIKRKAMILCSDNHDPREFFRKEKMWIKADLTFEGLKYAINDPENRIFIGEMPDKEQIVNYNKTKYIKSISIKKIKKDSKDIWFDNELILNKDLVTIIGNKGNGKSALVDIIAYTAEHKDGFSFLNSAKFKNKKSNIANNFESILTWEEDTKINRKNLGEEIDKNKVELVKYIPQSYLEDVCNEISNGNNTKFSEELGKVIFSHIPYEDRLGYSNIEELIENTTISKKNEKYKLIEKLKEINKKIAENTYKISFEYKRKIEEKLEIKRKELQSLTKEQPEKVEKPENSEKLKTRQDGILKQIDKINLERTKLNEEKEKIKKELAKYNKTIQKVQDMIEETNSIISDINTYKSMIQRNIEQNNLELKVNDIIEIKINNSILENYQKNIITHQQELSKKLDMNDENSIEKQIYKNDKTLQELTNTLDEPNKKYKRYEIELKNWTDKIEKINGDKKQVDTIRYLENELIKIEGDYIEQITDLENEREEILENIYGKVSEQIKILKKYYKSVQDFIDNNKIVNKNVNLKFNVTISASEFKENFLKYIDMGKTGTYYRNNTRIDEIMEETEFSSLESIKQFTKKVLHTLQYNESIKKQERVEILSQLRDKEKFNELLDYIFSLEYLNVKYELRLGEKPLESLSPGEKGLLLLVFYLLIDKSDCPLIIDQPEENLDNNTITKILVPCILEARKRRQIIMVTHNPNLAVVCDAEQIIYCEIQKNNKNKVIYESGSLENPKINKRVTDILEGTMKAFRIRDERYQEQEGKN